MQCLLPSLHSSKKCSKYLLTRQCSYLLGCSTVIPRVQCAFLSLITRGCKFCACFFFLLGLNETCNVDNTAEMPVCSGSNEKLTFILFYLCVILLFPEINQCHIIQGCHYVQELLPACHVSQINAYHPFLQLASWQLHVHSAAEFIITRHTNNLILDAAAGTAADNYV